MQECRNAGIGNEKRGNAATCNEELAIREIIAERGGFEPPDPLRDQRFSRPPHSTALASLRSGSEFVFGVKCVHSLSNSNSHHLRGERGIRTPGGLHLNGFQDRRNRPLCHLSGGKSKINFISDKIEFSGIAKTLIILTFASYIHL